VTITGNTQNSGTTAHALVVPPMPPIPALKIVSTGNPKSEQDKISDQLDEISQNLNIKFNKSISEIQASISRLETNFSASQPKTTVTAQIDLIMNDLSSITCQDDYQLQAAINKLEDDHKTCQIAINKYDKNIEKINSQIVKYLPWDNTRRAVESANERLRNSIPMLEIEKDSFIRERAECEHNLKSLRILSDNRTNISDIYSKAASLNIPIDEDFKKIVANYSLANLRFNISQSYGDFVETIQTIYKREFYTVDRKILDNEIDECKDAVHIAREQKNQAEIPLENMLKLANEKFAQNTQKLVDNQNLSTIRLKDHPNSDEPSSETISEYWIGNTPVALNQKYHLYLYDIQRGKKLLARENRNIPDGTIVYPIRMIYGFTPQPQAQKSLSQDLYFYKDPFGQWIQADNSIKLSY
jgi:hypothetical protein